MTKDGLQGRTAVTGFSQVPVACVDVPDRKRSANARHLRLLAATRGFQSPLEIRQLPVDAPGIARRPVRPDDVRVPGRRQAAAVVHELEAVRPHRRHACRPSRGGAARRSGCRENSRTAIGITVDHAVEQPEPRQATAEEATLLSTQKLVRQFGKLMRAELQEG